MLGQVILDVEAIRDTDSEDGSGWTYGVYLCPHHDEPFNTDWPLDCIGSYSDPFELIWHMQECHRDVDLDKPVPGDVDLDPGFLGDVDLDG